MTEGLRNLGFRVAIDDFGVDNANFQLFFQLGFDVLKIDKSLVWGLDTTDRTVQVICSLVSLCDELGIVTVAEGVETGELAGGRLHARAGLPGGTAAAYRGVRATVSRYLSDSAAH